MKRVVPVTLILFVCLGAPRADGQALHENAEQARSILKAGVHALTDLASPHSIEPLRHVLEDEKVPEVVFAAAKALEKLHDPAGTKAPHGDL